MTHASQVFAIRPLADGGTTLEQLRQAALQAPATSNVVFLRADQGKPAFPLTCPQCERSASSALLIERAFVFHIQSHDDTPNDSVESIDSFTVPFCNACVSLIDAEKKSPSPWTPLLRILSKAEGFSGLFVIGIAIFFVRAAVQHFSLFPLVFSTLPFAIGFWLIRSTWIKTRRMSLPQPTRVDLAIDFTPVLALDFERAWRAFQFRSRAYADLFRSSNAHLVWNPLGTEGQLAAVQRQRRASRSNWIFGAIIAAILLWSLWKEILSH